VAELSRSDFDAVIRFLIDLRLDEAASRAERNGFGVA
jgi:hypothetical protein